MPNTKLCMRLSTFIFALVLLCAICAPPTGADSKLNIMTATTDLAALAQEIGGDKVNVESVARGYQDPHFVEAFLPHAGGEPGGGPEQRSPGPAVVVPVGNPMDDRLGVRLRVEMAAPVVPDVYRRIDYGATPQG